MRRHDSKWLGTHKAAFHYFGKQLARTGSSICVSEGLNIKPSLRASEFIAHGHRAMDAIHPSREPGSPSLRR
jgi:hypothetical protein